MSFSGLEFFSSIIFHMLWGFGGRPCVIGGGGYETGFSLFRGVLGAIIVKPDVGELALSNRGGLTNRVLTLYRDS